MKNVNGARFQLLLGRGDWGRCVDSDAAGALPLAAWWSGASSPAAALPATLPAWDLGRDELMLRPRAIELPATLAETPLTLHARRGAAADRHGNVYRIADDRRSLHVASVGSGNDSLFWPAEPAGCAPQRAQARLAFDTHAPAIAATPETYFAMAVTHDDWLVVAFERGALRGLLSFDLIAGGQPLDTPWPDAVPFAPFDMCARDGGGVWILDRENLRLWELDCTLAIVRSGQPLAPLAPEVVDDFQPLSGPQRVHAAVDFPGGLDLAASPGWVMDPIAVEPGLAGSVWLLDRDELSQQSRVVRLRRNGQAWSRDASDWLPGLPAPAHDFVHAAAPRWPCADAASAKQLFVSTTVGNQVHVFDVLDDGPLFALHELPQLYPLRRYGGRALIVVRGDGRYDSGLALPVWTLFVQQPRARFETEADLVTPVFDSGELGTTWDKLLLDAAIPAGTTVKIWSRAADEHDGFEDAFASPSGAAQLVGGWNDEPMPLLRPDGSELPWLRRDAVRATRREAGQGTWELLFQAAQGRYLQLKLRLRSEHGTNTPRLRALRVWSPRFSYPQRFLPAVYGEDEACANFLERWLANFESTLTGIEDKVARAQTLFDARTVPAEALGWLAEWFDLALDPAWDERRHRLFVRHAMDFFRWRGTVHGLRLALELAFDPCFDPKMFDGPRDGDEGPRRIRIVETYRTRLIGALAAGDPGAAPLQGDALQLVATQTAWTPAEGSTGLVDRWARWQGRTASSSEQLAPFPLVSPANDADAWVAFSRSALGFVPAAGAQERARWQAWLLARHGGREQVNQQHGTAYASVADIALPVDAPSNPQAAADWAAFSERSDGAWTRARWQDFLARRYRRIDRLKTAHGTHWSDFHLVALPDALPASRAAQTDWLQFEGQLLAMHRTAHRFSVLLPVASVSAGPYELEERLGLARRVVDLEKPAHTVFDVRFFWAFNRVGEARLGQDTQIGAGSRAPELIPDAVVGRAYVGASFVAGPPMNPSMNRGASHGLLQ
ncbi:phage tail protein [Cupriavidus necator]|uniref:phage tail protein n=1 Tax=Cupriavidus necator TaxID=106590 RepID=UPI0039C22A99